MKKIFIIATLALAACTGNPPAESNSANSEEFKTWDTLKYQYEPAMSTLNGTLVSHTYFGPPGYGEDTLADEKERVYMIRLDKSINIQQPKKDLSNGYNVAINDVVMIQLLSKVSLDTFLNKTVTVTGTLFGAQTGHHRTDVLLEVKTIQ